MSISELTFMNVVERRNYIDEKLRENGLVSGHISADRFLEIWAHYDKDGNLTIEEQELDNFLAEYLTSAHAKFIEVMSEMEINKIKRVYRQGLEAEEGGRISLEYMAKLLPVELGVFVLFQTDSRTKTAGDFMEIWKKHDKDLNGYIDTTEFAHLLEDMLHTGCPKQTLSFDHNKAIDYAETFLPFFDINHDGKLGLNELARLLPSKENFVQLAVDKTFSFDSLTGKDVQALLEKYDKQNVNGSLEGNELSAFVRDLLATGSESYTADDVRDLERIILKACDLDRSGSIDAKELSLVIKSIANAKQKGGDGIYKFYHSHADK